MRPVPSSSIVPGSGTVTGTVNVAMEACALATAPAVRVKLSIPFRAKLPVRTNEFTGPTVAHEFVGGAGSVMQGGVTDADPVPGTKPLPPSPKPMKLPRIGPGVETESNPCVALKNTGVPTGRE